MRVCCSVCVYTDVLRILDASGRSSHGVLSTSQEMCRAGILVVRSDNLLSSSSMWGIPNVDVRASKLTPTSHDMT